MQESQSTTVEKMLLSLHKQEEETEKNLAQIEQSEREKEEKERNVIVDKKLTAAERKRLNQVGVFFLKDLRKVEKQFIAYREKLLKMSTGSKLKRFWEEIKEITGKAIHSIFYSKLFWFITIGVGLFLLLKNTIMDVVNKVCEYDKMLIIDPAEFIKKVKNKFKDNFVVSEENSDFTDAFQEGKKKLDKVTNSDTNSNLKVFESEDFPLNLFRELGKFTTHFFKSTIEELNFGTTMGNIVAPITETVNWIVDGIGRIIAWMKDMPYYDAKEMEIQNKQKELDNKKIKRKAKLPSLVPLQKAAQNATGLGNSGLIKKKHVISIIDTETVGIRALTDFRNSLTTTKKNGLLCDYVYPALLRLINQIKNIAEIQHLSFSQINISKDIYPIVDALRNEITHSVNDPEIVDIFDKGVYFILSNIERVDEIQDAFTKANVSYVRLKTSETNFSYLEDAPKITEALFDELEILQGKLTPQISVRILGLPPDLEEEVKKLLEQGVAMSDIYRTILMSNEELRTIKDEEYRKVMKNKTEKIKDNFITEQLKYHDNKIQIGNKLLEIKLNDDKNSMYSVIENPKLKDSMTEILAMENEKRILMEKEKNLIEEVSKLFFQEDVMTTIIH